MNDDAFQSRANSEKLPELLNPGTLGCVASHNPRIRLCRFASVRVVLCCSQLCGLVKFNQLVNLGGFRGAIVDFNN